MRKIVLGMLMTLSAPAAAADVDWKMYGTSSVEGQDQTCFYEAGGVARMPGQHVRVWIKCLADKDMESIDPKSDLGRRIVDDAGRRLAYGYEPPIAAVEEANSDQIVEVTWDEEIANIGGVEPVARIFYELDCPQKMLRQLSIDIVVNGKRGYGDTPRNWQYIPPEGSAARLVKILCR